MEESFSAKRHDATTIKNHVDDDDLAKLKVKIDELNVKVTEVDNALFDSNRRQIESCHKFSHDANEEFLESLKLTRLLAFLYIQFLNFSTLRVFLSNFFLAKKTVTMRRLRIKQVSPYLRSFQNVVLILSNCDHKNGCSELVFGTVI